MKERRVHAILPATQLSRSDHNYAVRMGIIKEPRWRGSEHNNLDNVSKGIVGTRGLNLGDPGVMPAGDIQSGWGRNLESKTGIVRRMR